MLRSFFPVPKLFFGSAVVWPLFAILIWYFTPLSDWSLMLDWARSVTVEPVEGERPPFLTAEKLYTYLYIIFCGVAFAAFWTVFNRNRWHKWSVLGSTFIIVWTYFNVQISVFLNDWYGRFYDFLQEALTNPGSATMGDFYGQLSTVLPLLLFNIFALVLIDFFISHYLFRWRTAMNDYYAHYWPQVRHIEGAAQRIQEDTQRFARIMEGLGVSFVRSVMTLIAFLPLLYTLSQNVTEIPFFGAVDGSMVYVALISAALGTVLLAVVGYRLPGLEFNNQKVEAAYRKELVYGEDSADHCAPPTLASLFSDVRTNYFRLYFNYLYFNVARYLYLQGANFVPLIALGPTIVAGTITFGIFTQINNAFNQVENSFQFLANSWTTIIDLISIFKRLAHFETAIEATGMPVAPDEVPTLKEFLQPAE
ncbi:MAG: peptide antibiotic transporter SbmA [Pseudomonadota bacterium]